MLHEETPINRLTDCCSLSRLARDVAGGANRDRTGDLLLAKQALSQLSYGPARAESRIELLFEEQPIEGGRWWSARL